MSRIILIDGFSTGHHPSYAATLARSLKMEGHTVIAVGASAWYSRFSEFLDESLQVEQEPFQNGSLFGEWVKFKFLQKALSSATNLCPDIIHLLWVDHYIIATTLALALGKINLSNVRGTIHWGYMLENIPPSRKRNIKNIIECALLRGLTKRGIRFMVHSLGLKKSLSEGIARTANILYLNTGFDFVPYPLQKLPAVSRYESRNFVLSQTKCDKNSTILLLFGGWAPYKGADIAIEALASLPSTYHLLIAGQIGETEKAVLFNCAEQFKVRPQVHIQDVFIPDSEIPLYFKGSDIVVIPYRHGFSGQSGPLALAAALGMPIVASRLCVIEETVNKYQLGKTCDPENPRALAYCLQTLADSGDEHLTKKFVTDHADESFMNSVLRSYFFLRTDNKIGDGA